MGSRDALLDEITGLERQLNRDGLPEQTSSLLEQQFTVHQFFALLVLADAGQLSSSDLARALHVRPNVMTGITQRLVERGLVARREVEHDRRLRMLSLTAMGTDLVGEVIEPVIARRRAMLDRLSDEQLAQLATITRAMLAAAPPCAPPAPEDVED